MTRMVPLYQAIATALDAYIRCASTSANESQAEWESRWQDALSIYASEFLPHGSGFDVTAQIQMDEYRNKLVITGSFHKMDSNGYYDGWQDFVVKVTPSLIGGFDLKISGARGDLAEYIADAYGESLSSVVDVNAVLSRVSQ